MKLQPDRPDTSLNVIAGYAPGAVTVNGEVRRTSVIVPWTGAVSEWPCQAVHELTAAHFESIAALAPEVVLFGSGKRIRFAHPEVLRPLIERGIGVETMDTAAACRTYSILMSEGRTVVAALLIDAPA